MSPFLYFLAGLLVGWLLQLTLEVLFFRRKTLQWRDQATKAVMAWTESEKQVAGLRVELAATKANLASTQASLSGTAADLGTAREVLAAGAGPALAEPAPTEGPAVAETEAPAVVEPAIAASPVKGRAFRAAVVAGAVAVSAQATPPGGTPAVIAATTEAPAQAAPSVVALTPTVETLDMAPCVEPDGTLDLPVEPASPAGLPPAALATGRAAVTLETAPAAATEIPVVPVETASMRAQALHGEVAAVLAAGPNAPAEVSAPGDCSGSALAEELRSVVGAEEASHAG